MIFSNSSQSSTLQSFALKIIKYLTPNLLSLKRGRGKHGLYQGIVLNHFSTLTIVVRTQTFNLLQISYMQVFFNIHSFSDLEGKKKKGRGHTNAYWNVNFKLYYKMHVISVLKHELPDSYVSLRKNRMPYVGILPSRTTIISVFPPVPYDIGQT